MPKSFEKGPELDAPAKEEAVLNVTDLDEFIKKAKKTLDTIFDQIPSLAKPLLQMLERQIEKVKTAADLLTEKHAESLDNLKKQVEDDILRFDNNHELQLLGIEQEEIEKKEFNLNYKGKNLFMMLNNVSQVKFMRMPGVPIYIKGELNIRDLPVFYANMTDVIGKMKNSENKPPNGTQLTAEGLSRFSYWKDNKKYIIFPGGDIGVLEVEDPLSSDEELEMTKLEKQITEMKYKMRRDIAEARAAGKPHFKLEDVLGAPAAVVPETFRDDITALNKFLIRFNNLKSRSDEVEMKSSNGRTITMTTSESGENILSDEDKPSWTMKYKNEICIEESTGWVKKEHTSGEKRKVIQRKILGDGTIQIEEIDYSRKSEKDEVINHGKFVEVRNSNGELLSETQYAADDKIERVVNYENGEQVDEVIYGEESGTKLFSVKFKPKTSISFFDAQGNEYGNYQVEKQKNPNLTKEDYFKMLGRVFNTPERWNMFMGQYIRYKWDVPDDELEYEMPSGRIIGDYWQTARETIENTDRVGRTLGDCEDIAFLAQSILKTQGIKAQVINIPGHAICAWIKKRPDGLYDAHGIDTGGYDMNGGNKQGYLTPVAALNSLFAKYKAKDVDIPGVEEPIDFEISDNEVEVLSIPQKDKKSKQMVSVNSLVN